MRALSKTRLSVRFAPACAGAILVVGCATGARATLENRFQAIGIPEGTASCMVDDLADSLTTEDLSDLAQYTLRVSRAPTTTEAIASLARIDNPRAVAAVGQAGISCVTGFNLGGRRR
ncbi:MAG: hypothetical protein AAFX08_12685 [Pseudomonadota bacterium]